MVALAPDQLEDLVRLTLENPRYEQWTDVSLPNQKYYFADRFIRGKKKPVKGGTEQTWVVQTDNTNTFHWTGLFGTDRTDIRNLSVKGSQQWAMATVNFQYDVNESEFQGGDFKEIVSVIKMREHAMYGEWFANMESALWTSPSSSSQDPRPMSGLPFWIQKAASTGFNGGNPANFASGAGNIDASANTGWKNYTYTYGQVTEDDFVAKTVQAMAFCNFQPPHKYPEAGGGEPDWALYTTFAQQQRLRRYLNARNDNLRDVAGVTGSIPFESVPVYWVPELTHSTQPGYDSTDPFYGVNWKSFEFYFQKGREMQAMKQYQPDRQPTVRVAPFLAILNMLCRNRRANFVSYKV